MDIGAGFLAHARWLVLLGQLGKGDLRRHEPAHQGGGMGFYDRGEQCLLAGKVTVKGAGGYPGLLHDLPQRGAVKALFGELLHRGFLDFLQCNR